MDRFFLVMLCFVPVTIAAEWFHLSPLWIFGLASLAIIPLAKFIGEATEELSAHTGPGLGGLLNATFGNATELIIGILALKAGLVEVVKASITGSILGNLLLVLGSAMFFGGLKRKKQTFTATTAKATGTTLLLAVIALVMPAIFIQTTSPASGLLIEDLSVAVSIIMIVMYIGNLVFSLVTHKHLYIQDVGSLAPPNWSVKKSIGILLAATLAVSWMSEILVGAIEPLVTRFGWTELFIGTIFVAIIGNAAEHASAITVAIKNKMDLSIQVSMGSATQIVMLVAPILVLSSLFFPTQMSLVFNPFELAAIILTVFIVNSVIEDGESNWLEGLQLLIAYFIIGIAFYFHS